MVFDEVEQYERHDMIILNGPSVPPKSQNENTFCLSVAAIKGHLRINVKENHISAAHRFGPKQNQTRPIMVKLMNMSLKYEMIGECIKLTPGIYVNESLTPKRLNIMKKVLATRKQHRQIFQQYYTKDGKIKLKLKTSAVKHTIVDESTLLDLLGKYPSMKDTYQSLLSSV